MLTTQRIDKWLWVSRFYKTRGQATTAVKGGKVQLNKQRIKPGHAIKVGDALVINKKSVIFEVSILTLPKTRRPAKEACLSYQETVQSIANREQEKEMKQLANACRASPTRKPDKRAREKLRLFKQKY